MLTVEVRTDCSHQIVEHADRNKSCLESRTAVVAVVEAKEALVCAQAVLVHDL